MVKNKIRLYCLYGDTVEVAFSYNEASDRFFWEYPDFDKCPRTTPCGRQWVNATKDDCPYANKDYCDCGSCSFYKCERPGDLIGVCENERLRKE